MRVPPEVLTSLAELVERHSGLHFAGGRRAELDSKAARVFAEARCSNWDAYLAQLSNPGNRAMLDHLIETLTVGETYFFRHRPYFELLEREVLPALITERRPSRQLRFWSAGCATGEEAYSLAILVRRVLPDLADWGISILATDLNSNFLAQARAGLYGKWSFRETDDAFRAGSFIAEGERYRIRPELRRLVRFAPLNLAGSDYPSSTTGTVGLDMILCRNVLMYFEPELARQVLERLHAALVPGGWLVLGPSDTLPGHHEGFEMHAAENAVLYRRVGGELPSTAVESPRHFRWMRQQPTDQTADDDVYSPVDSRISPHGQLPGAFPVPPPENAPLTITVAPVPALNCDSQEGPIVSQNWHDAWLAAHACAGRGEIAEAEAYCRQAMARTTLRAEPYYLLGVLQQMQGDDQAALVAFRKALYVDRTFAPPHLALASLHRRAGRPDRARLALERAQRLLSSRADDEMILAEEGLTVGRLRDVLVQALEPNTRVSV